MAPRLITVLGILAITTAGTTKSCRLAQEADDDNESEDFRITLELQDGNGAATTVFRETQPIRLVLRVRNLSDDAASIDFTGERTYDFVVLEQDANTIVWQHSDSLTTLDPQPTQLQFAANEEKTFTATWDQRRQSSSMQVRDATYEARGVLLFDEFDENPRAENAFGSPIIRFTID